MKAGGGEERERRRVRREEERAMEGEAMMRGCEIQINANDKLKTNDRNNKRFGGLELFPF